MRRKPANPINTTLLDSTSAADILELRRQEEGNRASATLAQWRENSMAGLYGRHVFVDHRMEAGTWRHKQCIADPMNPGQTCWIMRRGRVGVLPPAILLRDAGLRDFEVAPDVADRLIARDSGLTKPGRPI